MVPALTLWLPILLSAVFVFIASSLIHMVVKYHNSDFKGLPSEEDIMGDLRKYDLEQGEYYMPYTADFKERDTPEFKAKMEKGPCGFITITSSDCSMATPLLQWFVYSLLVGFFTAYVCGIAMGPGAGFMEVFRMAGTVTFAGYSLALIQNSIWYKRSWGTTVKYLVDGFIYGCVTAATFAWLWP